MNSIWEVPNSVRSWTSLQPPIRRPSSLGVVRRTGRHAWRRPSSAAHIEQTSVGASCCRHQYHARQLTGDIGGRSPLNGCCQQLHGVRRSYVTVAWGQRAVHSTSARRVQLEALLKPPAPRTEPGARLIRGLITLQGRLIRWGFAEPGFIKRISAKIASALRLRGGLDRSGAWTTPCTQQEQANHDQRGVGAPGRHAAAWLEASCLTPG